MKDQSVGIEELTAEDIRRFRAHYLNTRRVPSSPGDECREWPLALDRDGYGWFKAQGKQLYAHRVAYWIHSGHINDGLLVCHSCDNPSCVKPFHLWQGTHVQNHQDKARKGRVAGEQNPHAKVSKEQMTEILQRHRAGEPVKSLAQEFGYSRHHLYKVIRGDQWSLV